MDSRLHAVIPAAGRGMRLSANGICQPYMKPLMAINGEPIVARLARQVHDAGAEVVTIVVAPENSEAIHYATRKLDVRYAWQGYPTGPLDALRIGVANLPTKTTLMVSADNLLDTEFIVDCVDAAESDGGGAVGVDFVHRDQVRRFSRLINATHQWEEGPVVTEQPEEDYLVWAGPLVFSTELLFTYDRPSNLGETLIGPALNHLEIEHYVQGTAYDIGVPEAWENT